MDFNSAGFNSLKPVSLPAGTCRILEKDDTKSWLASVWLTKFQREEQINMKESEQRR